MPQSNIKVKKNTKRVLIKKKNKTKSKKTSLNNKNSPLPVVKKLKLNIVDKLSPSKLSRTSKLKIQNPNHTKKNMTDTDLNTKPQVKLDTPKKISMADIPTLTEVVTIHNNPPSERLNEKYIELLTTLGYVMRYNKDFMRARAYGNALETVETFSGDITSPEQLKGKKGIGVTIYQKLIDYNETGSLKVLERNKEIVEKKKLSDVFADIYGVGEKKAEELVDKGVRTIKELEKRKDELLNDKQKIGLQYYDDILKRIPRDEIVDFEKHFALSFPVDVPDARYEIVGSYRRGMSNSGDIDVIVTSSDPNTFKTFIDSLIDQNVIIEVLSRGNTKCLVVAKLPWGQYARRVDFLYSSPTEFAFSILYFTGSKAFNTSMRERALNMGYSMNEHGFSIMDNKKKGPKVAQEFPDEKSIFDFLKMDYKTPLERIDGTAVIAQAGVGTRVLREGEKEIKPKKLLRHYSKPLKTTTEHVAEFKSNGMNALDKMTEKDVILMLGAADVAFHQEGTDPIMSDAEYDILHEYVETKYPQNQAIEEIGAPVTKNKATLPYEMWSMDKIKPDTGIIGTWMKEYLGDYIISGKLDGVSGMYTTEGDEPKLYTRGNGKVGQDVSHLIGKLRLPTEKDIVIRGEFIIKKEVFKTKYADKFSNPRNMVAGIVNQITQDKRILDVDFVAYEVIKPANLTPAEQMTKMDALDVIVVRNEVHKTISNEVLSELLVDWRNNYDYEIDGIIVANDKVYARVSGNPKHTFAFKMVLSDQMAEAHVVDVIWTPSKDGYLKPRVQIMPVHLGGVTIKFATGFNAKFIEDNKIGIGAIIQLIRSGDVIPKIQSVTQPAENPKMPNEEYEWNETRVDVMLKDADNNGIVLVKNITGFFKGLEVDGLGAGNVEKMVKAGYNSIPKIIKMTQDDYLKVDGFKEKTATKLYEGIQKKVTDAPLYVLMGVSNKFGRGFSSTKTKLVMTGYHNVLDVGERNLEKLTALKGIEKKSAEAFLSHVDEFIEFMKECGLEDKLKVRTPTPILYDETHPLFGKNIVMTGFRDKELENQIIAVGGKMGSGISKNTFVLLVKNLDETSGKIENAKKLGIEIMTKELLLDKYM